MYKVEILGVLALAGYALYRYAKDALNGRVTTKPKTKEPLETEPVIPPSLSAGMKQDPKLTKEDLSASLADIWEFRPVSPAINKNELFAPWISNEFKNPAAKIRLNLEKLLQTNPEFEKALLIGIRGDCDCRFVRWE